MVDRGSDVRTPLVARPRDSCALAYLSVHVHTCASKTCMNIFVGMKYEVCLYACIHVTHVCVMHGM